MTVACRIVYNGTTTTNPKAPYEVKPIIREPIIGVATKCGGSSHVIIPKEWIGKKIRCVPVDQE